MLDEWAYCVRLAQRTALEEPCEAGSLGRDAGAITLDGHGLGGTTFLGGVHSARPTLDEDLGGRKEVVKYRMLRLCVTANRSGSATAGISAQNPGMRKSAPNSGACYIDLQNPVSVVGIWR